MMQQRNIRTGLGLLFCALGLHGQAQLIVSNTLTPTQLVQNVLLGGGISVSNITFNGVVDPGTAQQGSGSFEQVGTLGVPSGVVLSTGFVGDIAGSATGIISGDIGNNGDDPDLESIVGGPITNYSILEFDFVPVGDSVKFNYVWGSEEYPGFVCSFNDAFGFFLSGPGISGPYTNGAINIAVLPDGVTPVTIANVNGGAENDPDDPICPAVNPDYYVNNLSSPFVAFNGLTTVLTAKAQVQCGETYHIKLAVADAGGDFDSDRIYDSGVFLEGGSFTSAPFVPNLTPGPGISGNTVYESCFDTELSFVRLGDVSLPDTFQISYSGTFTNGVDIVPAFPTEVIFTAGQNLIPFIFSAPIDEDEDETFIITIISVSECTGEQIESVFTFNIGEAPALQVEGPSFSVDCENAIDIAPQVSGGYGAYVFDWGTLGTDPSIYVAPLEDTSYPVTVSDNCGLSQSTTIPVTVLPSPNPFSVSLATGPTVTGSSVQESCFDVVLNFTRSGDTVLPDTMVLSFGGQATPGVDYTALPDEIIFQPGQSVVSISTVFMQDADGLETFTLSLGDASLCTGGLTVANFTFNITQAPAFVAMGGSPTIACGASATLNAVVSGGFSPYTYAWPGGTIGNSLVVQPTSATIYDLEVTDACGNEATATFNVDLLAPAPLNMTVQGQNSVTEACTTANINLGRPQGAQGPLTVELSFAGSATPGVDYEMSPQQLIPEGSSNIVLVFEAVEDGQAEDGEEAVITASFTDQCGRTVTSTVTLTILDAPLINIASNSNETVPCSLDSIPLVAMAEGGVGSLTYSWNTGVLGPVAYAGSLVGGTYIVTATDACGRSASASTTISVDCDIVVPNVFTPNNDGTNDRFEIEGILSAKNTVKVFNRWGQVVFEANNYRNNWAATGLPEGTYFYEVVVEGHEKPYTGDLTIMRN